MITAFLSDIMKSMNIVLREDKHMKIKKGKTVFTIIGAIFFIIGMILVVIGGISLARTSAFMNSAQKTKS